MKMVKSLLLGSAAGLVAVAGAQAADLPVKAKAVEYVKVCSLYGAGFYYIPGTDTCIKIGGFVRTEWDHNANGSFAPMLDGTNALYTRDGNTLLNRSRGIVTFDTRSQTEFGTLRSYLRAGWQWTSQDATVGGSSSTVYLDRAFIQIAGFTFGKTQSFFDFFCTGCYSLQTNKLWVDTGGSGTPVFAYTAQLGNGVTATVSIEDYTEQRLPIVDANVAVATLWPAGATQTARNRGYNIPDVVGNIRVDQAWGSAQVMGALHNNAANYYTGDNQTAHPDEKWGWAVGAGLTLKMPWSAKDTLSGHVTYCEGAARYCSNPSATLGSGSGFGLVNETDIGVGWIADAYYNASNTSSQLELTQAFSAVAAFEHYWTPTLRTSIYGGYFDFEANSAVVDATCGGVARVGGGTLSAGCADWSAWQVGSRTLWNPVANLDVGLDIIYTEVDSALKGAQYATTAGLPPTLIINDTHVWSGILRIQRNFWP
ncbi:MAG: polymerase [Alphaproteobacteria bacterium]|nr:MAG: polymerase [Alphaproteobacteria bacterium]